MADSADRRVVDGRTPFELRVHSPEGLLFAGQIVSLVVPGVNGRFGVLAHHAPLLGALSCGVMEVIHGNGKSERMAVGEGFVQVGGNAVRLTVHFMDLPPEIDQDRAHRAMARALSRLRREVDDLGFDVERAEAALCRAVARLSVCGCGCGMCHTATSMPLSSAPRGLRR